MSFTGFYQVLLGFTGFYGNWLGLNGFYWIFIDSTGFSKGFTEFYWIRLGFTGCDWVLLGSTGFCTFHFENWERQRSIGITALILVLILLICPRTGLEIGQWGQNKERHQQICPGRRSRTTGTPRAISRVKVNYLALSLGRNWQLNWTERPDVAMLVVFFLLAVPVVLSSGRDLGQLFSPSKRPLTLKEHLKLG